MKTIITALVAAMRFLEPLKRIGWRNFNRPFRRGTLDIHERIYSPLQRKLYDIGRPDLALIVGGATNEIHKPGWNLSVVIDDPAAPNSGDPVRFGNLTGIAMLDEGEGGAGSTETPTYFGPGVYDMTVDDNEGTAIAVGDDIFYHDSATGSPAVNLNNSATSHDAYFGVALEVVGANATTLINVLHIPIGASIALANNAVATAMLADDAVTSAKLEEDVIQYVDVQLTNAQVLAFRATPIELIAAPGANRAIIVHAFLIVSDDAGGAWTESTDNLVIQYADGVDISAAIEAGDLVGGAVVIKKQGVLDTALVPDVNAAVEIFNTGDGEWGGGNAANTMSIRCWFSVVDTVAFS